jgi:ketosteroid isomerase-like protein
MKLTPLQAVREYYESLAPGRRQELMELLDPHLVLEIPAGFPGSAVTYRGLKAYIEDFLYVFYGNFDLRVLPEEFLEAGDQVVALGRLQGHALPTGIAVNVPFAHVWTVRDGLLTHGIMYTDTAVLWNAVIGQPSPSANPS